jgi:hypothetical protein
MTCIFSCEILLLRKYEWLNQNIVEVKSRGLLYSTIFSFERSTKPFSHGPGYMAVDVTKVWWNLLWKAFLPQN